MSPSDSPGARACSSVRSALGTRLDGWLGTTSEPDSHSAQAGRPGGTSSYSSADRRAKGIVQAIPPPPPRGLREFGIVGVSPTLTFAKRCVSTRTSGGLSSFISRCGGVGRSS